MKNRNILLKLALVSILFITNNLYSQSYTNLHFRKIGVNEGLTESSVYSIIQDSKGYMWFGTKDGLNRYDGNNFKKFRQNDKNTLSIGNNFIRSIIQKNDSTLYIGTDAGLYIMDLHNETFYQLTNKTNEGEQITSAVNSIYQDELGMLWVGTMTQEVFKYNPKKDELVKVKLYGANLNHNAVWKIYCDKSNEIWIGTRMGLLYYNKEIDQLIPIKHLFSNIGDNNYEILTIEEDSKGLLWLGTWDQGLILYNKQNKDYKSYFGKNSKTYISHIRSLNYYDEQNLFIGSDDGLYRYNTWSNAIQRIDTPHLPRSLSDQNVYSMLKDSEGGLWIGTYFGGVNYLNTIDLYIETYYSEASKSGLSGKAISQFCEDEQGNIWIATEDGGINYFNTTTKQITQPVKTSYHNTHALILDNNLLYIGTFSRGLDIYNTKSKTVKNYISNPTDTTSLNDNCIFSIYKTKTGSILIGTPVGLNKFNKENQTFTPIHEARAFIYDIKEDNFNNLWIATYGNGVIKYNYTTSKWTYYDKKLEEGNPIVGSKLTSIYIDNSDKLIFTSEGRGVFIYDYKTDRFTNISEAEGFPNNVVYGVLEDSLGYLWFSCNRGLVCMRQDGGKEFKLYTKDDGLQSNQFNFKSSLKAKDGKLYFGGVHGFNCFYPQDVIKIKNKIVPTVQISDIKILNNEIDKEGHITADINNKLNTKEVIKLPWKYSSFTISFISLSYISQEKNQYAYKLDGVDKNWNFVGNNKNVTYVNLAPGKYNFRVKGSNNDNLWNKEGATIAIQILPPFWKSIIAQVIYLIIIILVAFQTIRVAIKRKRRKQQYHLETIKNEQEALAFQSKIDFFTNIAHEIRTPLTLINAPVEEIIESGDGNTKTRNNLEIINNNCTRLLTLVSQLLDFRKMSTTQYVAMPKLINLQSFYTELINRIKFIASSKKVKLTVSLPNIEKDSVIFFDEDALTKISTNLITNAIKFANNSVEVLLVKQDNNYLVEVKDDGRGISNEHKKLIFEPLYQINNDDKKEGSGIGLSLVKYLSDMLNCEISVTDNSKQGSIFSFVIKNIEKSEENTTSMQINISATSNSSATDHQNRILIVDDNVEMTQYLKQALQDIYLVDTALHVNEALTFLESENTYDLIIADIMMPDIDGLSFTKSIKENVNCSHIPVILLSAKTENTTKVQGLELGANVFIEKPFSILYLKAQIASLFSNRENLLDSFNRNPFAAYSTLTSNKKDEEFLQKLNTEIENNISDKDFTVEYLSDTLFMSRSNLQRKLKSICGVSPGDYLRNYRLRKSCQLLIEKNLRINEIAYAVGFSSASYFTKAFIKTYGVAPSDYIKENQ